jgi:hypothetical protein
LVFVKKIALVAILLFLSFSASSGLTQPPEQNISPSSDNGGAAAQANNADGDISPSAIRNIRKSVNEEPGQTADQNAAKNKDRDAPRSLDWFLLGDNPAQATMAWASVAASAFSLLAIVLLFLTLRDARRSDERQMRAYMHVRVSVETQADHFRISLVGKNHGQTPAYRVMARCSWSDQMTDTDHSLMPERSRGSLGPGEELHMTALTNAAPYPGESLTEEQCVAIRTGATCLYVYGRIDYVDAFNKPRWTTFRHRLERKPEGLRLTVASDGNDSN